MDKVYKRIARAIQAFQTQYNNIPGGPPLCYGLVPDTAPECSICLERSTCKALASQLPLDSNVRRQTVVNILSAIGERSMAKKIVSKKEVRKPVTKKKPPVEEDDLDLDEDEEEEEEEAPKAKRGRPAGSTKKTKKVEVEEEEEDDEEDEDLDLDLDDDEEPEDDEEEEEEPEEEEEDADASSNEEVMAELKSIKEILTSLQASVAKLVKASRK